MPRHPSLAIMLGAGALATPLLLAGGDASAQATNPAADSFLMNPALDGDPRNPPRFRNGRTAQDTERFGQLPNFD